MAYLNPTERELLKRKRNVCPYCGEDSNMKTLMDRLMSKISPEPNSGCWLWLSTCSDGYGQIRKDGKYVQAHRVAYELIRGPIPIGLELDHLCRVRCCVNPFHLEAVTHPENLRRSPLVGKHQNRSNQNRNKTHCPYGHPLDGTNKRGDRYCRECNRHRYWRSKASVK
jgi:hypothetical protein